MKEKELGRYANILFLSFTTVILILLNIMAIFDVG